MGKLSPESAANIFLRAYEFTKAQKDKEREFKQEMAFKQRELSLMDMVRKTDIAYKQALTAESEVRARKEDEPVTFKPRTQIFSEGYATETEPGKVEYTPFPNVKKENKPDKPDEPYFNEQWGEKGLTITSGIKDEKTVKYYPYDDKNLLREDMLADNPKLKNYLKIFETSVVGEPTLEKAHTFIKKYKDKFTKDELNQLSQYLEYASQFEKRYVR